MLIRHRHKRVTPDLELIKFSRHLRHGRLGKARPGKMGKGELNENSKWERGKYLFERLLGILLEVIVSVSKSVES